MLKMFKNVKTVLNIFKNVFVFFGDGYAEISAVFLWCMILQKSF